MDPETMVIDLPKGVTEIRLRQYEQQEIAHLGIEQKMFWKCELADTCTLEGTWDKKVTETGDTQLEAFENATKRWNS